MRDYTYNDILEAAYRHRERMDTKLSAWLTSIAVGNLFAEKPKSLSELFPEPKPKPKPIDAESLKQKFSDHKIIILE